MQINTKKHRETQRYAEKHIEAKKHITTFCASPPVVHHQRHTTWAPKGRSQAGPKGFQPAPRLLVYQILYTFTENKRIFFFKYFFWNNFILVWFCIVSIFRTCFSTTTASSLLSRQESFSLRWDYQWTTKKVKSCKKPRSHEDVPAHNLTGRCLENEMLVHLKFEMWGISMQSGKSR